MIETIKGDVMRHLHKEVKVVSKENRNRNEIFFGKVVEIYAHIFVVSNGSNKKSYSYSDILSRDIQVTYL